MFQKSGLTNLLKKYNVQNAGAWQDVDAEMKFSTRTVRVLLMAALLLASCPSSVEAKSYSSGGGHSYSSHSSSRIRLICR